MILYINDEGKINTGDKQPGEREATQEEREKHLGIDFESLRKKKIEELKAIRNSKESGGFPYMGKVLDSDALSCQRISLAAQSATLAIMSQQPFPEIQWSCADNTTLALNAQSLAGIPVALAMFSAQLHGTYGHLKSLVEQATTKDELELIKWPEE